MRRMRWRRPPAVCAVAASVLVLACGDVDVEDIARGLTGEPVPESHADYVGEWEGAGMSLRIGANGMVSYRRQRGSGSTSLNAPIQRFEGDDFVVGLGPVSTTFRVSERPHREGDTWTMTVDGVELVRVGRAEPDTDGGTAI